jgi:predicted nucleotidyltransferase
MSTRLVSLFFLTYADDVSDAVAESLRRFFDVTAPKGLVSAYLFGSHAEARSHRESDVDLAVLLDRRVFDTNRKRFEERLRLIGEVGGALRRSDVDLVVLNDAPPELGARIATRGLRLFCSNPELDHAFVRDIQLRAADLAPFLRRMRSIKMDALKR